jgi:hypothetical protein
MSHKLYRSEKKCLNCGAHVESKFCGECGQENIDTHETFVHLVGHFVADYLHFDSKFFRSLVPLFTKPGFLTKEYWAGRRVSYIHPLRLFFFITIIFMIGTSLFFKKFGPEMKSRFLTPNKSLASIDSSIWRLNDTTKVIIAKKDSTTVGALRKARETDLRQFRKLNAGLDVVFTNFKYVTFFLLPIYALIFKLFYVRRKSLYVDHLVSTIHFQCFVYLSFTVLWIMTFLIPGFFEVLRPAALLVVFVYLVLSLRNLYQQSWGKTILKSFMATFLLFFTTALVVILLATLDAMYLEI